MITLIFLIGCRDDATNNQNPNASQREKQYFKDYESPDFKWGFINKKGKYVIEPRYDDLRDFHNGIACASLNGRWGMIDQQDQVIVDFKYLDIQYYSEGLALVEDFDQNKYYIDNKGTKLIDCHFESCHAFHNNKARFTTIDFTGFINKDGSINKEMKYSTATDFVDGYSIITIGNNHGIIDTSGQDIVEPNYSKIKINENIAVLYKGGKVIYFDLKKKEIMPQEYTYGTEFKDGYAVVKSGNEYGIIDKKFAFTSIINNKIRYLNEYRWAIKSGDGYLIIDKEGNPISEKVYTNLFKYYCGIIGMEVNENWGYVDLEGVEVLSPQLPIIWDCSEDMVRFITNAGYGYFDIKTNIQIAPQFIEARDFVEGLARVQKFER